MLEFSVKRHLMASEVKLLSSLLPSSLFLTSRGCMGSTWGQKASVKHWSTRRSTCCYCWVVSRSVRRPRYHSWPGWAVGRRSPAWSPSVSGAGVRCASALSPESLSPSPGGKLKLWVFFKKFLFLLVFCLKPIIFVHLECVFSWSDGTGRREWAPRPPVLLVRTEQDRS